MLRSGEDMIRELVKLMGTDTVVKTATEKAEKDEKRAEKKEEKKCEKCEKELCECKEIKEKEEAKAEKAEQKEEDKKEKEDAKKDKKNKKKKAEVMLGVVSELCKLANDLDTTGADEAASLVDEALQVIMKNVDKE